MSKVVVVGIGTDVGKTVVSSILVQKFKCAYWKPIQAGDLNNSDSIKIRNFCSFEVDFVTEIYRLKNAFSPHYAASLEGIEIKKENLHLPKIDSNLIIEAAGGLMVPLNNQNLLFIDLIKMWKLPVVLVSKHYLGSINHTLLSLEILKKYEINLKALIWIGNENSPNEIASEKAILNRFSIEQTHKIPLTDKLNRMFILREAAKINFEIF